jgi:hypothetical protein
VLNSTKLDLNNYASVLAYRSLKFYRMGYRKIPLSCFLLIDKKYRSITTGDPVETELLYHNIVCFSIENRNLELCESLMRHLRYSYTSKISELFSILIVNFDEKIFEVVFLKFRSQAFFCTINIIHGKTSFMKKYGTGIGMSVMYNMTRCMFSIFKMDLVFDHYSIYNAMDIVLYMEDESATDEEYRNLLGFEYQISNLIQLMISNETFKEVILNPKILTNEYLDILLRFSKHCPELKDTLNRL